MILTPEEHDRLINLKEHFRSRDCCLLNEESQALVLKILNGAIYKIKQ